MIFFERSKKNTPDKNTSDTHKKITLTQQDELFLVFKGKGKTPDSLVLITTPNKIKELNRYGINNPGANALTSQVTATLGLYRQTLVKRIYQNQEIKADAKAKEHLIKIAQTRIDHLCPLEQLINHPHCDFNKLQDTLEAYLNELNNYKTQIKQDLLLKEIQVYDSQISLNLEAQIERDIQATEIYLNKVLEHENQDISHFLSAYGPDSLQSFIKQRLISIVRQTQLCNQNIAYRARAKSRGSLHDHCEQAMKQIQQSNDLHNRVLPEHQCNFSAGPHRQALECSIYDTNLLMCLYAIDDPPSAPSSTSLSKTWPSRFKNLLHWLYEHSVCAFIEYSIDLPLGILSGLFSFNATSISKKITLKSPWNENTNYEKLLKKLALPETSGLLELGQYLGGFLHNTLLNTFRAIKAFAYEMTIQLVKSLEGDYYSGHWQQPKDEDDLYHSLEVAFKNLLKDPSYQCLFEQQSFKPTKTKSYPFARPAYELNPFPYNDILNLCASRLTLVIDHINSIPRSHPFSGLLLMLFYISALSYLLAPGLLHCLLGLPAVHAIAPQTLNYPNFIAYLCLNLTVRTSLTMNDRPVSALTSGFISLVLMLGFSYIFWAGEKVLPTLPWNPNQPLPILSAGLCFTRCLALAQNHAVQTNTRKDNEPKHDLLKLLLSYQPILYQLSPQQKCDVRRWIEQTHPKLLHTFNQWFEPQSSSALVTTLTLIAKHLTLMFRCLCTPITWSIQPFIELRDLLIQDAARIIYATGLVLYSVINTVGIMIRAVGDLVGNVLIARIQALFNDQTCAEKNYELSEKLDHIGETVGQSLRFGLGLESLRKKTTSPHPWTVYDHQYDPGFFTQADETKPADFVAAVRCGA